MQAWGHPTLRFMDDFCYLTLLSSFQNAGIPTSCLSAVTREEGRWGKQVSVASGLVRVTVDFPGSPVLPP